MSSQADLGRSSFPAAADTAAPPRGPDDRLSLLRTTRRALGLPGNVLRQVSEPFDFDATTPEQRRLLGHWMVAAMYGARGIGVALPMFGIGLRAIAVAGDDRADVLYDPEVLQVSAETDTGYEANLCMPGVSAEVERPTDITLRWRDADGAERSGSFQGIRARTVAHELELLDGRIFTDAAEPDSIRTNSVAQQAAFATAHVFGKSAPPSGEEDELPGCLTLPPALQGIEQSVLRRPAAKVRPSAFKRNDLRRLVETMFHRQFIQRGVGLAAPQIGLGLRLAVIANYGGEPLLLLNPTVLEASDETESDYEGCLSVPGWRASVERPLRLRIRTDTPAGKTREIKAEGFLARVIQHEIDHLGGRLYTDRLTAPTALQRNDSAIRAERALAPSPQGAGEPSGSAS